MASKSAAIGFRNGSESREIVAFRPVPRRAGGKRTQWSSVSPRGVAAGDEQIRETQQQRDPLRVLRKTSVAHLRVAELHAPPKVMRGVSPAGLYAAVSTNSPSGETRPRDGVRRYRTGRHAGHFPKFLRAPTGLPFQSNLQPASLFPRPIVAPLSPWTPKAESTSSRSH